MSLHLTLGTVMLEREKKVFYLNFYQEVEIMSFILYNINIFVQHVWLKHINWNIRSVVNTLKSIINIFI